MKSKFYFDNFRMLDTKTDDDDGLSTFDKVEIRNISEDESVYIMNEVNVALTLQNLKSEYNVSDEEVEFYAKHIKMTKFQTSLVFQLFASRFGSCNQLYNINLTGYATLIAIMKKMLDETNFVYLQHLLSGRMPSSVNQRKRLNKNEIIKLVNSDRYKRVMEYNYPQTQSIITKNSQPSRILSSLLNSEFTLVDYDHPELLGETIEVNTNILCEDFTKYIMMI